MSMKTQEQIDEQVRLLKEVRPKIVPASMFGDDNLAQLDAAVRVLEKNMDDDDIWERWDREEDLSIRSSATNALNWLAGESENDNLANDYPLA